MQTTDPTNAAANQRVSRLAWALCAMIVVIALVAGSRELATQAEESTPLQMLVGALWVLFPVVFAAMGALIASRQPRNAIGWLLMIPATAMALDVPVQNYIEMHAQAIADAPASLFVLTWYYNWSWSLLIVPFFLVSLLFPTGRPPSRRWRWVFVLGAGVVVSFAVFGAFLASWETNTGVEVPNPIGIIPNRLINVFFLPWGAALVVFMLLCVASLFVRFRRAGGAEREQIKWLLYAFGLLLTIYLPQLLAPGDPSEWAAGSLANLLLVLGLMAIPAAIAIAILRYRLYDIDIIIRKTLLYAVLTALLALVYFGSIAVLQGLFAAVSGQSSAVVVVISTLVIAALFAPLRRRLQEAIDLRFYRRKYDAEQVLERFAQTARQETDLDSLTTELARVVQETMQPERVSVWLKETHR